MKTSTLLFAAIIAILVAALGWAALGRGGVATEAPMSWSDDDFETVLDDDGAETDPLAVELDDDEGAAVDRLLADGSPESRPEVLIRGRIVDAFAQPLEAAVVRLEIRRGFRGRVRESRLLRQPVTTGPDGRFAFQGRGFERLSIRLQVRHREHAPGLYDHTFASVTGPLDVGDIQLVTGGRLVGQVTDTAGTGVFGAEVTLRPDARNPLRQARDRDELLPPAKTGSGGFYAFEHLLPGAYRVSATARHMQSGSLRNPLTIEDGVEEQAAPIELGPGFELTGSVFGPDGQPLADAEVRVHSSARGENMRPFDAREASANDGRFAIDHIPGAPMRVEVRAKDCVTWTRDPVDPTAGQPLIVRLEAGLVITGRVIDGSSGEPVERFAARARRVGSIGPDPAMAEVEALRRALERMRQTGGSDPQRDAQIQRRMLEVERRVVSTRERTDGQRLLNAFADTPTRVPSDLGEASARPDGRFRFDGLDEGIYVVDVQSPEHQFVRSGRVTLSTQVGAVDLQISALPGFAVAGVNVAGAERRGVEDARVELMLASADRPGNTGPGMPLSIVRSFGAERRRGRSVDSTRSDERGRFRFENLPGGRYFVSVRHSRFATASSEEFELDRDRIDLEVHLRETATLFGRVAGIPPGREGDVQVLAFAGFGQMRTARANPDGTYRLENLQPGGYVVRAFAGDTRSYLGQQMGVLGRGAENLDVDVTLGESESREFDVVVEIPPVGKVHGRVIHNDAPAAGMRINVYPPPGSGDQRGGFRLRGGGFRSARTDSRGEFEIDDTPPGEYVLIVQRDGRRAVQLHRETIGVAADNTLELQIVIRTGRIRGRVKAADGPPPEQLNGQLFVLSGVAQMPENLGDAMRNGISQRVDVRGGAFESGDLPLGPALVVLQIAGRDRAHEQVQVVPGVSELELGAGSPSRVR